METKTSTELAELYGLKSSVAFNKLLVRCGILVEGARGYVLAEHLRGRGYACAVTQRFFLPSGVRASRKRGAWTPDGCELIRAHLLRLGICPASERKSLFT